MSYKPKLRPLDFQPVSHQGQQMWYLRDPMQLTDYQLIFPTLLAQMLIFCDGTRTPSQIYDAFCTHIGGKVDFEIITNTLDQLDEACLLSNERSQKAVQQLLQAYRAQPHRPPALADLSYPGHPQALSDLFASYANGDNGQKGEPWRGRALISPHIDYQRGGPVYSRVWRRAQAAILEADMILIFGTDHNGGLGTLTLTHQPYATPYGVIPTDHDLIDKLATAIGPEAAFAEELNHRVEHSVELSAVWLHYICHQANVSPPPMIPILCGSFHHFVTNGEHPANDAQLTAAIETLQQETANKRVLAVSSVDLAHVGPNFGDEFTMDDTRRTTLKKQDGRLIEAILQGDEDSFYSQIANIQDQNRICGFSSIYLMLRYLQVSKGGVQVSYDQCPADAQDASLVSICGLLLN